VNQKKIKRQMAKGKNQKYGCHQCRADSADAGVHVPYREHTLDFYHLPFAF
jgi:hypothetical protein